MGEPVDLSMLLFDPAFRRDPHPYLKQAREHGAVQRSAASGVFFVLGHAEAVFMQRSTALGRDLRLWDSPFSWCGDERRERDPVGYELYSEFQPQMFNSNPPDHKRMRSVFQHAFTPRNVARMEDVVRREATRLADALPSSGETDLLASFAGPLPVSVISGLFQVPAADAAKLVAWSRSLILIIEMTIRRAQKQAALEAMREFKSYLRELVAERRKHPGESLVDHVIAAEGVEGGLAEDELLTNLVGLLIAGHETTTNLIGNGMLSLLRNPAELAHLRGDLSLVPTAVEELLRFEPSVSTNGRVAIEDVQIGETPVPKGSMVIAMVAGVNRDPSVFEEPERLDVARGPNPHQTFGGGMHHCIGAPLARLEAKIALETLLERYPTITLAGEPAWLDRINVRGLEALPIALRSAG